jgi:beta-galactosidase
MQTPVNLAPGLLSQLIDMRVTRVESLPDYHEERFRVGNRNLTAHRWRETIETRAAVLGTFDGPYRTNGPALIGNARVRYLAALPLPSALVQIMEDALDWAGVAHLPDLGDLRLARRDGLTFAFNYGAEPVDVPVSVRARFHIGARLLPPVGVAVWTE